MFTAVLYGFAFLIACQSVYSFTYDADPTLAFFLDTFELHSNYNGSYERFGTAIDSSGDLMVSGAPLAEVDGEMVGGTDVFRYNAVTFEFDLEARLYPSAADSSPAMNFGGAVAVSDNYIAVGASMANIDGAASGAVFVFKYDGTSWGQTQILQPSDPAPNSRFGQAVSIDGNLLAVGSSASDLLGAAYVFNRDGETWTEQARLVADDRGNQSSAVEYRPDFGIALAIDDEGLLLVGSPKYFFDLAPVGDLDTDICFGDIWDCEVQGAAYMFRREFTAGVTAVWVQDQKLTWQDIADYGYGGVDFPQDPPVLRESTAARFGSAVALKGSLAVIGAPRSTGRIPHAAVPLLFPAFSQRLDYVGRVFVYEGSITFTSSSWNLRQVFQHSDAADSIREQDKTDILTMPRMESYDYFGSSVAIGGTHTDRFIVVGAPGNDNPITPTKNNTGAVYLFGAGQGNPAIVPAVDAPWVQFGYWFGAISNQTHDNNIHLGQSVTASETWFASGKPNFRSSEGGVELWI